MNTMSTRMNANRQARAAVVGATFLLSLGVMVAPASADWTDWISEEKPNNTALCPWDEGTTGAACFGSYCDWVALRCARLPTWSSLDYGTTYWSPFFSEEGRSDLEQIRYILFSDGTERREYSSLYGRNVHICFRGVDQGGHAVLPDSPEGIVTGMACSGRYCDNISLECTKPTVGRLGNCQWSPPLSEEQYLYNFGDNRFVTAVECTGSYCDNKRFYVCSLQ